VNEIQTADWGNFFVAEVGASAALTGLVAVAISINLARILAFKTLPGLAASALILLGSVLVLTSAALIPHQPMIVFGLETLAIALAMLIVPALIQVRALKVEPMPTRRTIIRAIINGVPGLAVLIASILLIFGHASGLYWIAAGAISSLISGVLIAWVLLIEILR
jgi:modulator of FtsH protease